MCSLYLGENLISGNKPINLGVRNIGEIVASPLPLTDAGLHLLDGSLILGGGIYQGFVDYIADLYTQDPTANYFTDEATWQTAVTTYGVCGKFVYDSVNNTVRLPKVTGIIEGTTDVSALGDLVEAGLPNITGDFNGTTSHGNPVQSNGCIENLGVHNLWWYNNGGNGQQQYRIDASLSNSIYGNSSTVQPQTIKAFYYIVISNSTKTDIQVDIDEIATDLNGKADTDLTNVNNSGTSKGASWAMPSTTYEVLTVGASWVQYTAPANGYFVARASLTPSAWIDMVNYNNGIDLGAAAVNYMGSGGNVGGGVTLPVLKGQKISLGYGNISGSNIAFKFVYAKGSESEAS